MWTELYKVISTSLQGDGYKPAQIHYMTDDLLNIIARADCKTSEEATATINNVITALNKAKEELKKHS